MKPFAITLAVLVALARPAFLFVDFNSHVDASYQAVAHFLVGGLFAVGYVSRSVGRRSLCNNDTGYELAEIAEWTIPAAWLLTAVEVVCAVITITRK